MPKSTCLPPTERPTGCDFRQCSETQNRHTAEGFARISGCYKREEARNPGKIYQTQRSRAWPSQIVAVSKWGTGHCVTGTDSRGRRSFGPTLPPSTAPGGCIMFLYHKTSSESAAAILRVGFKDG